MERLVDKIDPNNEDAPETNWQHQARRSPSGSSAGDGARVGARRASSAGAEVLNEAAAGPSEGPVAALLSMRHDESVHRRGLSESKHVHVPALMSIGSVTNPVVDPGTPSRTHSGPAQVAVNQHGDLCKSLRDAVPHQAAVDAIVAATSGTSYVAAMCYGDEAWREGKPRMSLTDTPSLDKHPLLHALRSLQILVCIQKLLPTFNWSSLGTAISKNETIAQLARTTTLVTSNDTLMGYAESIECLLLEGIYQTTTGNLRQAWLTFRRALNLGVMMGLDKRRTTEARSCDPTAPPRARPSTEVLWSRVLHWERYLSLLLGLPIASHHIDLPPLRSTHLRSSINPTETLVHAHTSLMALIAERNAVRRRPSAALSVYTLRQEVDLGLHAANTSVPPDCWETWGEHLESGAPETMADILATVQQFTLPILLHVPYMLQDLQSSRHDYSKVSCLDAARLLLRHFEAVRTKVEGDFFNKAVEYPGLVAAMTLCLSYLAKRRSEVWERRRVKEDRELVEEVTEYMESDGDALGKRMVGIIKKLAQIMEKVDASFESVSAGDVGATGTTEALQELRFQVPFMGTIVVTIPPSVTFTEVGQSWQGGHRRHPSSATGALQRMALGSPTRPVSGSHGEVSSETQLIQLVPYRDENATVSGGEEPRLEEMDFMADGTAWPLQGVDAAFWDLLLA